MLRPTDTSHPVSYPSRQALRPMADVDPAPPPPSSSRFQPYTPNPYLAARDSLTALQDSLWELGRDKRLASEERKRTREAARAEAAAAGANGAVVQRVQETAAPEARSATTAAAVNIELEEGTEEAESALPVVIVQREVGRDGAVWETKTTRTRTCRTKEWSRAADGTGAAAKAGEGGNFRGNSSSKP